MLTRRNLLLTLFGLLFFITCSKDINGSSKESLYLVEPTIYYYTEVIDIPLPTQSSTGDALLKEETQNNLQNVVADYLAMYQPEGMGISIYCGTDTEWHAYAGKSDRDKQIDVTENTLFHSASSGKMIMSAIIFSLIQEGALHLDDLISTWFDAGDLFSGVTIDHLLSHTSGIVTFEIMRKFQEEKRTWSEEELVDLVYKNQNKKLFQPGTAFHYSNTGYVMLGLIAKKVTGETLEALFSSRIKTKAGLNNIFYLSEETCGNFPTASFNPSGDYVTLPDPFYASGPHGAGAFAGTPREFAHFLNTLMAGQILEPDFLQMMMSGLRLCEATEQTEVYYGRGIKLIRIIVPDKTADYIGHSGQYTGFGFTSQIYHCTNCNATICIMTNQEVTTAPLVFKLAESSSK